MYLNRNTHFCRDRNMSTKNIIKFMLFILVLREF